MSTSLIPDNDDTRLAALRRYQVLDATNERIFNELAHITAQLFQAPIALLSLVEEDEVLFKGNFGLPGTEKTERRLSMCSAAILFDESYVLNDLDTTPCQLTDPLLAQQLNLKFYAGHAIKTDDGFNIGTLCVIDHKPRSFSAAEDRLLTTLAGVAKRLLDLRLAFGVSADTSFKLWEPVYGALDGLLGRLQKIVNRRAAGPAAEAAPLTDAMTQEVADVATRLQHFIEAALLRV